MAKAEREEGEECGEEVVEFKEEEGIEEVREVMKRWNLSQLQYQASSLGHIDNPCLTVTVDTDQGG